MQGQSTKAQDPGAWATGIVEVALPVEYKMKNIEETEAAKRRLLHASRSPIKLSYLCKAIWHDAGLKHAGWSSCHTRAVHQCLLVIWATVSALPVNLLVPNW